MKLILPFKWYAPAGKRLIWRLLGDPETLARHRSRKK